MIAHLYLKIKPSRTEINKTLDIITPRKFDNGSSLKFFNKYYQPVQANENNKLCFRKGVEALIIKTFDNKLLVFVDKKYGLVEVKQKEKTSKGFYIDAIPQKSKSVYAPPIEHPWRSASFIKYLNTIKHQEKCVNI